MVIVKNVNYTYRISKIVNVKKAAACELLRTEMVGGSVKVFPRYHDKDITGIRFHMYGQECKLTKNIIDYDANCLYRYCSGDVTPFDNDDLVMNDKSFYQKQIE